ncbi:MAG: hypothetical protein ACRDFA_04720 [bacterium]
MPSRIIGAFLIFVSVSSGVGLAQDEPAQVIVSNEDAGTVTFFAGRTLRLVATVRVGGRPHNHTVLRGGQLLAAV